MPMDVDKCRLESEKRWSDVNMKIQKLQDEVKVMDARLNKQAAMVADIQQLSTSVSILANNMKSMLEEQQKQGNRIHTLEQKPAKRWDAVVDKIIMVVVGALAAALLIKLGLPA